MNDHERSQQPEQPDQPQVFDPVQFRASVRANAAERFRQASELVIVQERDVRAFELGVAEGMGIVMNNLMAHPLGMVVNIAKQLLAGQKELIQKPKVIDPARLRIVGP